MLAFFRYSGFCMNIMTESLTPCAVEFASLSVWKISKSWVELVSLILLAVIPTEVLHGRLTRVPYFAVEDSHYLMNEGIFTSLKVCLATSLNNTKFYITFPEDSCRMNLVQELSGETCAFSRLTSPSSPHVVGLPCISFITAASYQVSMKTMQPKKIYIRIIIHMEARSYQRDILAPDYDLDQDIPT